jgi:predicted RNA-binding protein with TRAM domain
LPVQVGEEVLVTIDEPHMYRADDAVARIDSYIISVSGGARHVGKRRLVRIESVDRAAALASLVDGDSAEGGSGEQADGDGLESRPTRRRRGRRGGRRRSRAGTGDGSGS